MNLSHPNPTYTHPHTTHTRRQTDHTIILKLQLGIQYYRYYIVAIHNTLSHAPATHTQQTIILSHVSHTVWENSVRKRGGDFHLQIFCCKFRAKFMPPNLTVWLLGWICLGGGLGGRGEPINHFLFRAQPEGCLHIPQRAEWYRGAGGFIFLHTAKKMGNKYLYKKKNP